MNPLTIPLGALLAAFAGCAVLLVYVNALLARRARVAAAAGKNAAK